MLYLYSLFKFRGLRNVQAALFCEDYPTLNDRQISKIKYEFPAELGTLKQGDSKNFQLHPEFGGGIIALRNLDDPSKYQSAEFSAIAVDELTKNTKETFDFLRFRLRWPGVERPKFAGATNPGGIGHNWVKQLWKEHKFPSELQPIADQFAFVQAKASDNPHLTAAYYQNMLTLPKEMARKFAEGDWDTFEGQYFPEFDVAVGGRHVISAAQARERVQPWHRKWLSGDWGFDHPYSVYLHSQDETGRVTTIKESWGRLTPEKELAHKVAAISVGHKPKSFVFSWDAGKLSTRSDPKFPKSISQLIGDNLPEGLPKPHPADSSPGSRIAGARLMAQLLEAGMWQISEDCPKLIECLPTLIHDPDNTEDVLKVDWSENGIGDDPYDAARMGLQFMLGASQMPLQVQRERMLAEVRNKVASGSETLTAEQLQKMANAQAMADRAFTKERIGQSKAFFIRRRG